jgi:putative ABC transport system permease protein
MGEIFRRIRYLISRRRFDAELESDMAFHREMAARAGRSNFGNTLRMRERSREAWGWMWLDRLVQDVRYAASGLGRTPGFTLTAVLTLAFGIGATTAIFSILEGVLLRPLPFAEPERLVTLGDTVVGSLWGEDPLVTGPEIPAYERGAHGFSSLGGYTQDGFELSGVGEPAQISGALLTASVFPTLGIQPLIGRTFTQQEDEGRQQVAVISYRMWRSRLHGDPRAIGQAVLLDRKPYQIIGVMPREFEFPLIPGQVNRSELWVPMSLTPSDLEQTGSWHYQMIGRLKPDVSAEQAQQDAERVAQETSRTFPPEMASLRVHANVKQLSEMTVAAARPMVDTLFLAVVVVLLMACANLAGLLLVRVIRRRREIAVRLALGANGAAVLRQSLLEAMLVSIAGGLLGLAFADTALRVGVSFLPESLPRVSSIGLDWEVISFALGITLFTGFVCGLLPAYAASRIGVNEALKEGGRTGSAGGGHARLRSILVIGQLVVALVLLTGSGLLLRSFDKLRKVDLGFRADHLLTASFGLPHQQYSTQTSVDSFDDALLSKLRQLPVVEAVGVTNMLPAAGQENYGAIYAEGYASPKGAPMTAAWRGQAMGQYFTAMGIPLLRGRDLTDADTASSPMVAIVNRKFAEHYWPGQDPIGKRIHIGFRETPLPWMTVVGEIGDIKQKSADSDVTEQMYQPMSQFKKGLGQFAPPDMLTGSGGSIALRSSLAPEQLAGTLRAVVRALDPQLPLIHVESMDQIVSEGQASRRFNTVIISSFAAAAVLLSLLGIYSVIAFSAALRTQEMAIRLALGAQRTGVMRLVLASGARLGLMGCGMGIVAAVFATRLMRTMLFQVDPPDPLVLVLAAISIFLLALAASVIPARRAAAVEPMQALRAE